MTLNRIITSLVQLALVSVTLPLFIAMIKDLKQLMKEEY